MSVDKKRLRRTALIAGAVVAGMTGMAFAAVPLYDAFCKVTGYGGTTQEAQAAPTQILDQRIEVRFDANTSPDLPVEFAPKQHAETLRIGETGLDYYRLNGRSVADMAWQRERFAVHVRAARQVDLRLA